MRGPVLSELFPLVLTPVLLAGMWYRNALPRVMRRGYAVLLGVVIVAFGALCMVRARGNVADPSFTHLLRLVKDPDIRRLVRERPAETVGLPPAAQVVAGP